MENTAPIMAALERIEARHSALERAVGCREHGPPPAGTAKAKASTRVQTGGNEEEDWLTLPEEQVASVMAPFANAQRLRILKALYLGESESGQLREMTGLTGGQLYHHLKELALAKFLSRQVRGEYRLSAFGYYTFSSIMILLSSLLREELDEDDTVSPEEIEEL